MYDESAVKAKARRLDPPVTLVEGRLMHGSRWMVPQGLVPEVVQAYHQSLHYTTSGFQKHWTHLDAHCVAPALEEACRTCIQRCPYCIVHKHGNSRPTGLMQSAPIPVRPLDYISIDFFHWPLVEYDGQEYDQCMLVIDQFSGLCLGVPMLKEGCTGNRAARVLSDQWFG